MIDNHQKYDLPLQDNLQNLKYGYLFKWRILLWYPKGPREKCQIW